MDTNSDNMDIASDNLNMRVFIFVLGAPGSGKGTLCSRLAAEHGFYHLSVGDFLRNYTKSAINKQTVTIHQHLEQHKLLPGTMLMPLLLDKIEEAQTDKEVYLIDGFPRNLEQADEFEKAVRDLPYCSLPADRPV